MKGFLQTLVWIIILKRLNMWTRSLIFLFLFISINGNCKKQPQFDTSVFIGGFRTHIFFAGEFNTLGVYSPNYPTKSLVIKASQGTLENIDDVQNGFLSLTNLKIGNVAISVFRQVDTGLQLLNKRVFKVIKKPLTKEEKNTLKLTLKPQISIEGYTDSIPINVLKIATKIDINEPLKITSVTFIIYKRKKDPNILDDLTIITLESAEFNENLKHTLTLIKSDSVILIEDIKAIDFRGKVYAFKSMNFKVIN